MLEFYFYFGAPGLVNSITAVSYHFCPSLPAAYTQPIAPTLADLCSEVPKEFEDVMNGEGPSLAAAIPNRLVSRLIPAAPPRPRVSWTRFDRRTRTAALTDEFFGGVKKKSRVRSRPTDRGTCQKLDQGRQTPWRRGGHLI